MRELVTIKKTDEGVKLSDGSSINFKMFKYIENFIDGYLVYDILEDCRSECNKIDKDTLILPVEALMLFKVNASTITDLLEKVQGKMNREVWLASNMLVLNIQTKNNKTIEPLDDNPLDAPTPALKSKKARKK